MSGAQIDAVCGAVTDAVNRAGRTPLGRRTVLGGLAAGVVGLLAGCDGDPDPGASAPPNTVTVTREDLVDFTDVEGELGFGEAVPLRYLPAVPSASTVPSESAVPEQGAAPPASAAPPKPAGAADAGLGLVTWLAPVGTTVGRGQPLLRVDDRPVVLLFGALPAYRTLLIGCRGRDVRQLETNLRALHMVRTVDDRYTATTAAAVQRWQRSLGLAETGVVEPHAVAYAPGPVRIAAHAVRVGDTAGGQILSYTGVTRSVTLRLGDKQRQLGVPGTAVIVRTAGGAEIRGVVDRIGLPTENESGETVVEAYVRVGDQAALEGVPGRVTVRFVAQRREGVLTVPVTALVALSEGGYGVQVVDGGATRYVAVRTGLFAGGRVEITAGDLTAGTRVAVPR